MPRCAAEAVMSFGLPPGIQRQLSGGAHLMNNEFTAIP